MLDRSDVLPAEELDGPVERLNDLRLGRGREMLLAQLLVLSHATTFVVLQSFASSPADEKNAYVPKDTSNEANMTPRVSDHISACTTDTVILIVLAQW